jgi:hypothetical protein
MSRMLKAAGAAVVGLTLVVAGGLPNATAKPPAKPGAVSGLALTVTSANGASKVGATWNASTSTTRYQVKLLHNGATLASAWATSPSWTVPATAPDGSTVAVSVTPYNQTRKGRTVQKSVVLPDVTAPQASYVVERDPVNPTGGSVTLRRLTLSDNVTPTGSLTQTVSWGDGSADQTWSPATATVTKTYPETQAVYHLTVTVKDAANNVSSYPLAVAVNDTLAPTGSYVADRSSAWASWTRVALVEDDLSDNLSADADIARVVAWGDGTPATAWAAGTVARHVYATAGSYTPTVTLTDEGGNASSALPASEVVVTRDAVRPTVGLTVPRTRKAHVGSWRTLRGKAADAQTGMRHVKVEVVEKRGSAWYGYRPGSKTWVKGGTKAAGWRKARPAVVKPSATGAWSSKVAKLTKGTLVVRRAAVDNVGNASAWKSRKQVLTKR